MGSVYFLFKMSNGINQLQGIFCFLFFGFSFGFFSLCAQEVTVFTSGRSDFFFFFHFPKQFMNLGCKRLETTTNLQKPLPHVGAGDGESWQGAYFSGGDFLSNKVIMDIAK